MRRRALATACALALALALQAELPFADAVESRGSSSTATVDPLVEGGLYVVLLRGAPVSMYDGADGFDATAPAPGRRLRANTPAAQAYREALQDQQQQVLDEAGISSALYSYTTAVNGFAANLTSAQVKTLMGIPDVLSVQASRTAHLDQAGSGAAAAKQPGAPDLRLARAARAWRAVGGVEHAGRGVVIGVIDSGVWPENPSFAALPLDPMELRQTYPGFRGTCEVGDRWTETTCTSKIVAARFFVKGFGADDVSAAEYLSPRDGTGHGSHTAATAAGNSGVDVTIDGQEFGHVSGVAPDAALSIYKACWAAPDPDNDGCTTADTVAAIDQAVSDGVDVLSYSASMPVADVDDAVEMAFLGAASAGVFVSTSAGDNGPRPGTVAHSSPWVTTVAASTQTLFQGAVRLANGQSFVGSMVADDAIRQAPLVYAGAVPANGSSRSDAALCEPGSLDARQVDGAIVVCQRGVVARVSKSSAVDQAGGVAMVLVNEAPGGTDTDVHAIPTVHVTQSQGQSITNYIASAKNPRASLDPDASDSTPVPRIADFSSRGPATTAQSDVLKPDVAAPGVSIVSAVAPASDGGRLWDLYSGTSMAAPQVAGLAALVLSAHRGWSPAALKSAIMTTAGSVAGPTSPLTRGAGIIRPDRALDPGLVYDADRSAWLSYLRGFGVATTAETLGTFSSDASDLNQPSIAIGALIGQQTVTRRVTNVTHHRETYTATSSGLRGVAIRVAPQTLRLGPGESARFQVTLTAQRAARYGQFATGSLTWTGSSGHVVTSPVVARPESIDVADELAGGGSNGSVTIRGTAGVTGVIRASAIGPIATHPVSVELEPAPFEAHQSEHLGSWVRHFTVTDRDAIARFEVRSDDGSDVDLYVYRDGRLVRAATSALSVETVTLDHPPAGSYDVYVSAPGDVDSGASTTEMTAQATFSGWIVPRRTRTSFDVDRRTRATGAEPVGIDVSWSRLDESQRWFGEIRYRDSNRITHLTIN